MNKYDGELRYSVVGYASVRDDWQWSPRKNDSLVVERQASRPTRIVAWCPTRDAANAARRLLSGECEVKS